MKVGILAVQGDVAEHTAVVHELGHSCVEVRTIEDLAPLTHLILPGGESTVMSRFLFLDGLGSEIQKRVKRGTLAVFGTCAGAILLSKTKGHPQTLGLLDIEVDRNAYGTQRESFEAEIHVHDLSKKLPVAFIRAPIITRIGDSVTVLANYKDSPVIVQSGRIFACTCHPEIRGQTALHRLFFSL